MRKFYLSFFVCEGEGKESRSVRIELKEDDARKAVNLFRGIQPWSEIARSHDNECGFSSWTNGESYIGLSIKEI